MQLSPLLPTTDSLTRFEAQALQLEDPRPYPQDQALQQLGHGLMNELLDLVVESPLEDFSGLICEALIGAFHSAAQRIERDADKARDALNLLLRDFDGSEVLDQEIQEATRKARAADVAGLALDIVRDAAAASYAVATGDVWRPWTGSVRATRTTAAQIEARDALRAQKAARHLAVHPGATVVAFRGSPQADTLDDANRIFDALNWARETWPDMALATSGAKGAESLAIKWAHQKAVTLVLARADFDRNGRAAPFRANEALMQLEPVCVLVLANSLNEDRAGARGDFGPALNLAQRADQAGVRAVRISAKRAPG
ncbi:MAG TPA: DUF2493 domain-containing protein [Caulobacteraceae bacterium]|jgi:hypothetical protein